jgi:secondary thiamine-phosphate synthase enzyme
MRQAFGHLDVATAGRSFIDVTDSLSRWLESIAASEGLLTCFLQHTSASLVVQENADVEVRADLERFFFRLVPDADTDQARGLYTHLTEGPDDMPAHVRAALTATQVSVPVREGRMTLGTWQAVYLAEHRRTPHRRHLVLHFMGA